MKDQPLHVTGGKTVCLYCLSGLGLILEDESSEVTYFNQVAGHFCSQRYAKGTFVFLDDDPPSLYKIIVPYMTNRYTFSVEEADFLDAAFANSDCAKHLSVDRTKLEESAEAWVYVKIDPDIENWSYAGFNVEMGILTWDNSD
jgi:hypothetical protein